MKFFNNIKTLNIVKLLNLNRFKNPTLYLLLAVLFVGVNLLVSTIPLRYDFSYGKAYTLSSSTKKIIRNLDDIVTIKFFASSDLPTRLIPLKNEVVDLFNEYKKENSGRITLKVLDPKKDQNSLNEVKELGIPELQFSQLEQNKYAVTASYFGIALIYGDKKEILPQVTDIESLEYNLTASIYKLTRKELIKVGVMGRKDSLDPQVDDLASFKKVMSQQFDVSFIDILDIPAPGSTDTSTRVKEIDPSYKTVFVFDDNVKEFNQQELEALKKYLNNKGKAIFLVDGAWVQDNLQAVPAKHNLFNLLNEYGVKLNQDLVLSTTAELVNFGNNVVSFLTPYPFWAKSNVFDNKSSYFSNVRQLTFPWVSSVNAANGKQVKEIIKTSKSSWSQSENFVLDPQNIPDPAQKDLKQYNIGAEVKTNNNQILVIPSSRFVLERFLTRTSDNLEFVLNAVNDYASGGALSGIRQRAVSFYPLPEIPDNMKDAFKYLNILLLPSLLGVVGALRIMKRK